jgi:hypothetical protein
MKADGPVLERLTHRLAECPPDFLAEPRSGGRGLVRVEAVVSDLFMDLGGGLLSDQGVEPFNVSAKGKRNFLRLVLVSCWLLHDEWFRQAGAYSRPAHAFLKDGLNELSGLVAADLFVTDADRREELARLCLEALDLRPQGESEAQSADRLKTMGSVERSKVLAATRAAEEHARKVREAMRAQAAREAAAKVNHE